MLVSTEGDHIKISASKYPFPTVCAQSQSVDWFHSISRTLKWNERERQKSFVVVEEGPVKPRRGRRSSSAARASARDEEEITDEEDEEATDVEEEKFDIDDLSSSESPKSTISHSSSDYIQEQGILDAKISHEKALEQANGAHQEQAEAAARALAPQLKQFGGPKSSGLRSGVETPDRFAGPHPHPPRVSPRHVQFISPENSDESSTSLASLPMERDQTVRGEGHSAAHAHLQRTARPRVPRDAEGSDTTATGIAAPGAGPTEPLRTPTLPEGSSRTRRSRSRHRVVERAPHVNGIDSDESHPRRAFAVWGQDESDSATSDSDL